MSDRSPKLVLDLITALDVVSNFAFLPHTILIDGVLIPCTFCNCYACVVLAGLGCTVPPIKANKQYEWFQSNEAKMQGWQEINKATAIARANLGYPVVAVSFNPMGAGHIGVGVPSPDDTTLWITAAGAQNFVRVKMEYSFGSLGVTAKFFTHP